MAPQANVNTVYVGLSGSAGTQQMQRTMGNLQSQISSLPEGTEKQRLEAMFSSAKNVFIINKGDSKEVIKGKSIQALSVIKNLISQIKAAKKAAKQNIGAIDDIKKEIDSVQLDTTSDITAGQEKEGTTNVSPQQVEEAVHDVGTQANTENKENQQEKTEVEQKVENKANIGQPTTVPEKQKSKGLLTAKVLKSILGAGLLGGGILGQYLLNKKNVEDQKKNIEEAEKAMKALENNPNADPKSVEAAQRHKEEEIRNFLLQGGLQQLQEHARKEKERKHDIGANLGNLGGFFGGRPNATSEIPRDIYRRSTGVGHKLGNLW